jgi:hypothetical protein
MQMKHDLEAFSREIVSLIKSEADARSTGAKALVIHDQKLGAIFGASMRLRLVVLPAIVIAVIVTFFVYLVDHSSLAHQTLVEVTDLALNAIQITRAKSFSELYGNYSRWHFNHPGPLFFYCYALGEALLYDLASIVSSPHAAHLLAGVFVQTFFIGFAILAIGRAVDRRWFLPMAALVAVLYMSCVAGGIYSIWAPHVLLGPFVAFVVACVLVSLGDVRGAPILSLAATFLCHGHVAQPMFVVPLTAAATVLFIYSKRGGLKESLREDAGYFAAAAVIIAIGLVPIFADAVRGADSNLARILNHIHQHAGDAPNPWGLSLAYLLGFAVFAGEGSFVPSYSSAEHYASLGEVIRAHAAFYSIMSAALVLSIGVIWRSEFEGRRFALRLAAFLAGVVALTLVWARTQTGEIYVFNTHFFYGVILLVWMVPVIALSLLVEKPRFVGGFVLVALVVTIALATPQRYAVNRFKGFEVAPNFAGELAAMLNDVPAVRLNIDEHGKWLAASTTANMLSRLGVKFYVPNDFAFLFSYRYAETSAHSSLPSLEFAPGTAVKVPPPGDYSVTLKY